MTDVKIIVPESLGRAAEKLADTVQHVIEFVAGPERVRARAQAHADAEAYALVAKANAIAEARELESRALMRLKRRETQRQKNIESIAEKAVLALPPSDQVSDQPVNEDWTTRFFEECQDISDEQMQQIWAKILAHEVARPGSFSPRTLSIVKDMTRDDAAKFGALCNFVWRVPTLAPLPVIFNSDSDYLHVFGIDFGVLMHLTSIGLVEFNNMTQFQIPSPPVAVTATYCDVTYSFQHSENGGSPPGFPLGHAMFTVVGTELFRICTQTRKRDA